MLATLLDKIPLHSRALASGLFAYGLAELSVRVVRLVTVILIARQLAPDIVGQAALTLTLFEIIRIFANIGVGQQIIAAPQDRLGAICNSAQRIFWIWCGCVAVIQLFVAMILAIVFGQQTAAILLAILSLVYALMPGGLVQCYLLMREGRAAVTAKISAIQTIADHLLTAVLLLAWPSPWAVILPKLLTAPIWLILTRRARHWLPDPALGTVPYQQLMGFGLSVLATDLLIAIRNQADKLIISAMFGVTALGTYFFAYNAGIGIISSLITAFGTVLYPTLCNAADNASRAKRMGQAVALGLCLFLPVIALQAGFAVYYVPLVFGDTWSHAAPLVAVLCMAGVPMLASTAATAWRRAEGKPHHDAAAQLVLGIAAIAGLMLGAANGTLESAAFGWVAGQCLVAIPIAYWVLRRPVSSSPPYLQKGSTA